MNTNLPNAGYADLYDRFVTGVLSLAIVGIAGILTFTQMMMMS